MHYITVNRPCSGLWSRYGAIEVVIIVIIVINIINHKGLREEEFFECLRVRLILQIGRKRVLITYGPANEKALPPNFNFVRGTS